MRRQSFSLVEMLVVIGIIGILAAMLSGVVGMMRVSAYAKLAETDIRGLYGAFEQFKFKYGDYPKQEASDTSLFGVSTASLPKDEGKLKFKLVDRLMRDKIFSFEMAQMPVPDVNNTSEVAFNDPFGLPYVVVITKREKSGDESEDKQPNFKSALNGVLKGLENIAFQRSGFYIYSTGGQEEKTKNDACIYLRK